MTKILGLDYAWGGENISPAVLQDKGYIFVCRYLSHTKGKNITREEAARLKAAGIGIVLVWETKADRAKDGEEAGAQDYLEARKQANDIGFPTQCPIYFAVDYDAEPSEVIPYFKGITRGNGVYGSYKVVKRLLDEGLVDYAWQTSAWSSKKDPKGGPRIEFRDERAQIYQYKYDIKINNVLCDENEANTQDYGQW